MTLALLSSEQKRGEHHPHLGYIITPLDGGGGVRE